MINNIIIECSRHTYFYHIFTTSNEWKTKKKKKETEESNTIASLHLYNKNFPSDSNSVVQSFGGISVNSCKTVGPWPSRSIGFSHKAAPCEGAQARALPYHAAARRKIKRRRKKKVEEEDARFSDVAGKLLERGLLDARERERERSAMREGEGGRNVRRRKRERSRSLKAKRAGCAPCITISLGKSWKCCGPLLTSEHWPPSPFSHCRPSPVPVEKPPPQRVHPFSLLNGSTAR